MSKVGNMNTHFLFPVKGSRPAKDSTIGRPRRIALRSNDHWTVATPLAQPIRCVSGTVWITCEGQREDVVLTAGNEWQPEHRGLTVVGALSDAVLSIAA